MPICTVMYRPTRHYSSFCTPCATYFYTFSGPHTPLLFNRIALTFTVDRPLYWDQSICLIFLTPHHSSIVCLYSRDWTNLHLFLLEVRMAGTSPAETLKCHRPPNQSPSRLKHAGNPIFSHLKDNTVSKSYRERSFLGLPVCNSAEDRIYID